LSTTAPALLTKADDHPPLATAIRQRDIGPHASVNHLGQFHFPIDPPPAAVVAPTVNLNEQATINDDKPCYLLCAEDIGNASYLTREAAMLLKGRHPGLFDELDDDPEESEGGGWDEIMSDPFNPRRFQQHQAIAKLIFEIEEEDQLDDIFVNPDQSWTAHKTTYGMYRTDSCYYQEDETYGTRLIIDTVRYDLFNENTMLANEVDEQQTQLDSLGKERDYYRSLSQQAAAFFANIATLLQDKTQGHQEKLYALNSLCFSPRPVTFNELLTRQDLIIGSTYQRARESFLQIQKPENQDPLKRKAEKHTDQPKRVRITSDHQHSVAKQQPDRLERAPVNRGRSQSF